MLGRGDQRDGLRVQAVRSFARARVPFLSAETRFHPPLRTAPSPPLRHRQDSLNELFLLLSPPSIAPCSSLRSVRNLDAKASGELGAYKTCLIRQAHEYDLCREQQAALRTCFDEMVAAEASS